MYLKHLVHRQLHSWDLMNVSAHGEGFVLGWRYRDGEHVVHLLTQVHPPKYGQVPSGAWGLSSFPETYFGSQIQW